MTSLFVGGILEGVLNCYGVLTRRCFCVVVLVGITFRLFWSGRIGRGVA